MYTPTTRILIRPSLLFFASSFLTSPRDIVVVGRFCFCVFFVYVCWRGEEREGDIVCMQHDRLLSFFFAIRKTPRPRMQFFFWAEVTRKKNANDCIHIENKTLMHENYRCRGSAAVNHREKMHDILLLRFPFYETSILLFFSFP